MIELARAVADALVPPRCAGCGAAGAWLCTACRAALDARQVRAGTMPIRAAGAYQGPLRDAIATFKYRGERGLAKELGGLVADRLAAALALGERVDAVVPVPLHPRRAAQRGYDQAALLAAEVARRTALPLLPALHRIRPTSPQVDLDRRARANNLAGAFVGEAGSLRGLYVALVDDVATTGATCSAAASALRACGARHVGAYVVALDE